MKYLSQKSGFTLIEVLLSLAIISIIVGITVPVYQILQNRTDLNSVRSALAQSLRRAQVLARSGASDSAWGVKAQTSTITLFYGNSYLTHDSSTDEVYEVPSNLIFSGVTEIIFSKLTGEPLTYGTTTMTSVNGEIKTIYTNAKGFVSY